MFCNTVCITLSTVNLSNAGGVCKSGEADSCDQTFLMQVNHRLRQNQISRGMGERSEFALTLGTGIGAEAAAAGASAPEAKKVAVCVSCQLRLIEDLS